MASTDVFLLEVVSKVTGELLVSVEVDSGMTILELKTILEPKIQTPVSYQDLYKDSGKCADEFGLAGLRASGEYSGARVLLWKRSPTDPKALLRYLAIANEHWFEDPSDSSCLLTVKYLLDSGIDPNLPLDVDDDSEHGYQWRLDCPGATAAHCAALRGWDELRYDLNRISPQPEVALAIFSTIFDHPRFTAADARCTYKDEGEFTILHAAVHGGLEAIVRKILRSDMFTLSVNCLTSWSRNALHIVAECQPEYEFDGKETILRAILDTPNFVGVNQEAQYCWIGNGLLFHPMLPYAGCPEIDGSVRCCKLLIEHPETDLNCKVPNVRGFVGSFFKGKFYKGGSILHVILRHPEIQCAGRGYNRDISERIDNCCRVLQKKERFTAWNAKDSEDRTILHYAAGAGLTEVCRTLLDCASFTEIDAQTIDGETALHLAARGNHVQVCLMVMSDHRCTVPCPEDVMDMTPLHYSLECSMEAFMADVEGEPDLDLEDLKCMFLPQPTVETGKPHPPCVSTRRCAISDAYRRFAENTAFAHLDMSGHLVECIFLSAAQVGAYTLCQLVIPEMPPDELDAFCTINNGGYGIEIGCDALSLMCSRRWDDAGHDSGKALDTIKLLLPRMSASVKQEAFYLAAANSSAEIFTMFLEDEEVDVNELREEGKKGTVLHDAIRADRPDHCGLILKSTRFSAADAKDRNGSNALMLAASNGALEVCRLLLRCEKFTGINDSDNHGNTALHMAAFGNDECGWPEIIDLILGDSRFTEADKVNEEGRRYRS